MIPNDPMILVSFVNTKLRDDYDSLEAFCEDMELQVDEMKAKLAAAGFEYDVRRNRFA